MSDTPSNEKIEPSSWFDKVFKDGIFRTMHQEENGEVKRMLRARDEQGYTIADLLANTLRVAAKHARKGDMTADDVIKNREKVGKDAQTLCDEGGSGGARLFVLSAHTKEICGLWLAMEYRHFQVVNSFYKAIEVSQLTFKAHMGAFQTLLSSSAVGEDQGESSKSLLACLKAWCKFTKQNISALTKLRDEEAQEGSVKTPFICDVLRILMEIAGGAAGEKQYKEVIELLLQDEIVTTGDFHVLFERESDAVEKISTCAASDIIRAFAQQRQDDVKDRLASLLSVFYELKLVPPFVRRHVRREADFKLTPCGQAIREIKGDPSVKKLLRVIYKHEGLDGFTRTPTEGNEVILEESCLLQAIYIGIRGGGYYAIDEMSNLAGGKTNLAKAFSSPKSVLEFAAHRVLTTRAGETIELSEEMLKLGLFYAGDKGGVTAAILVDDKVKYMRQKTGIEWWLQEGSFDAALDAKAGGNSQEVQDKYLTTLKNCVNTGAFRCLDYLLGEFVAMPTSEVDVFVHNLITHTASNNALLESQNVDYHELLKIYKKHIVDDAGFLLLDHDQNCVHVAAGHGNLKFLKAFSDTWPELTGTAFTLTNKGGFTPADIALNMVQQGKGAEYQEIVTFFKKHGYGSTGKIDKVIGTKTLETKQRLLQKLERKEAKSTEKSDDDDEDKKREKAEAEAKAKAFEDELLAEEAKLLAEEAKAKDKGGSKKKKSKSKSKKSAQEIPAGNEAGVEAEADPLADIDAVDTKPTSPQAKVEFGVTTSHENSRIVPLSTVSLRCPSPSSGSEMVPTPVGFGKHHLSLEKRAELEATARDIASHGKGIAACDEGTGTIGDRFAKVGIDNTAENRRIYRQMLFTAKDVDKYISAAILDPETVLQKSDSGVPFPLLLAEKGIIPGVKPHLKAYNLPGNRPQETVMQGLDSLAVRAREYYQAGCRFAKWRSPLVIGPDGTISDLCISSNMRDLARYALVCQSEGLMPIVEPDIVLAGDYDLETAVEVNVKVQSALYKAMIDHGVWMEGSTLKPNMVNPGKDCLKPYTCQDIGEATIATLRRVTPAAMPGVNFLSGGQTLENASARLSAINKARGNSPWNLSFSWSQALQLPLLELCRKNPPGSPMPLDEMSRLFTEQLEIAGAAARGEYDPSPGQGDHRAAV